MIRDLLNNSTIRSLIPAVRSTPATITGSAVDLRGIGRKVLIIADIGGVEASTSTAIAIQQSDDGTTWTALHTFAAVTAPSTRIIDLEPTQTRIRAVATLTGGTAATLAVEAIIYMERARPSTIL